MMLISTGPWLLGAPAAPLEGVLGSGAPIPLVMLALGLVAAGWLVGLVAHALRVHHA